MWLDNRHREACVHSQRRQRSKIYTLKKTGEVKLVHVEEYADKHSAMSREWHIKHMNRAEKLKLVETAEQDE